MTLPIPTEIVGDTKAIGDGWRRSEAQLSSLAQCLGRNVNRGEPLDYFLGRIASETETCDALHAEYRRRLVAFDLARADQNDPVAASFVRGRNTL